MVRLPKSIIKKYGITKRAWQVFRANKKPKTMGAKVKRRKVRYTKSKSRAVSQSVRLGAVAPSRPRRRAVSLLSSNTMKILFDGATIGGSALGTTFAVNKLPWIGTRPAWQKAAGLVALGLLGVVFIRAPLAKKISSGAIVGGVISGLMPLMPEGFRFSGGRELTADEMEELATMGGVMEIPALGRPFTPPATMGAPVAINAMGGRGGRNYAAAY